MQVELKLGTLHDVFAVFKPVTTELVQVDGGARRGAGRRLQQELVPEHVPWGQATPIASIRAFIGLASGDVRHHECPARVDTRTCRRTLKFETGSARNSRDGLLGRIASLDSNGAVGVSVRHPPESPRRIDGVLRPAACRCFEDGTSELPGCEARSFATSHLESASPATLRNATTRSC